MSLFVLFVGAVHLSSWQAVPLHPLGAGLQDVPLQTLARSLGRLPDLLALAFYGPYAYVIAFFVINIVMLDKKHCCVLPCNHSKRHATV